MRGNRLIRQGRRPERKIVDIARKIVHVEPTGIEPYASRWWGKRNRCRRFFFAVNEEVEVTARVHRRNMVPAFANVELHFSLYYLPTLLAIGDFEYDRRLLTVVTRGIVSYRPNRQS